MIVPYGCTKHNQSKLKTTTKRKTTKITSRSKTNCIYTNFRHSTIMIIHTSRWAVLSRPITVLIRLRFHYCGLYKVYNHLCTPRSPHNCFVMKISKISVLVQLYKHFSYSFYCNLYRDTFCDKWLQDRVSSPFSHIRLRASSRRGVKVATSFLP